MLMRNNRVITDTSHINLANVPEIIDISAADPGLKLRTCMSRTSDISNISPIIIHRNITEASTTSGDSVDHSHIVPPSPPSSPPDSSQGS